jgi:5-methylcytosine-specific restriction endonuclease McrA
MRIDGHEDCTHINSVLTVKIISNGSRSYRYQCIKCGEALATVSASRLSLQDRSRVPVYDDELKKEYWKNVRRRRIQFQEERNQQWWARYEVYIRSPKWRAKRNLVLARDKFQCQGCLSAPATQVHHLTYAHAFDELIFELISLCDDCHEQAHAKEDDQ